MTRKEIEAEYRVVGGIIRSPGKFESEPVFSPYFYEISMDGCREEGIIGIESEDILEFPELDGYSRVECWESNDGFFYCRTAR